jgi:hypothetical protein
MNNIDRLFIAQAFAYAMSGNADNRMVFTNAYGVGVATLLKGREVAEHLIELKISQKANIDRINKSLTMLFDVAWMGVSIFELPVQYLIIAISKRGDEFFTQIQSYTYDVNNQIDDLKKIDGIDYYDYVMGDYLDSLLND